MIENKYYYRAATELNDFPKFTWLIGGIDCTRMLWYENILLLRVNATNTINWILKIIINNFWIDFFHSVIYLMNMNKNIYESILLYIVLSVKNIMMRKNI